MTTPTVQPNDCPAAPGFSASVQTLILHEACEIAGGMTKLADLLRVSPVALARWLEGEEEPPAEVYQTCIDMVLQHE
jgi:hypothetical protein